MPRILVIEDNEALRRSMHRMLGAAGYEVQEAANGKEGLDAYRQRACDVVITDIVMPETEGLETIRELCRFDAAVKIIAISGAGEGRAGPYLELARKFGAQRVLSKPFTHDELLTTVAELLATVT